MEQPPTAIPRTKHGQAKIHQKLPPTTKSTRFSLLRVCDLDMEFCVTRAYNVHLYDVIYIKLKKFPDDNR